MSKSTDYKDKVHINKENMMKSRKRHMFLKAGKLA